MAEIPYQVRNPADPKSWPRAYPAQKVPLLADIRDESADDIRLVIEPRSRSVEPEMLMAALFHNSDLETRFSLNMNVLIDGRVPRSAA